MSLLIMATGIGSCFGGKVKQLELVSLHGAMEIGFNKIIFVICKAIKDDSVKSLN